ncbi:MAG: IPT/TIG domain-containing protein [Gemmatimonadetes bacterium]|nr:IPT/TIG domain-containing protein [Gemmatimonadota bacterium]
MRRRFLLTLLAAAAVGCGGDEGPPKAATLELVGTSNSQRAPAGALLAEPLAVLARAETGVPVVRAVVRWTVIDGEGTTLSDSVTQSDGNGRAEVALRLGPTPGEYRVRAELTTILGSGVVFSATATEPPSLTAVSPTTFGAGDTVLLTGRALSAATTAEIGSQPARMLSGSATELRVIAPICLVPGPVQLRVRVGTAVTNSVTATYQAAQAPLRLEPGEYASIDPAQLAGCATFDSVGSGGAEYLFAPQSVTGSPGVTAEYRLAGDSVVVTLTASERAPRSLPFSTRFHDLLRAQEREAAGRPRTAAAASLALQSSSIKRVEVGNRRTFKVCRVIPCMDLDDFVDVSAEVRWVGDHAAIYLDRGAPEGFTEADFDSLGTLFDEVLYDVGTRAFGAESDVDLNGVVVILFTTAVNGLTPKSECSNSIITGYFFGLDIDPGLQADPRSNKGEVFYAIAPDAAGTVTCSLGSDVVLRLVPVTFVHEFQHMISYNQHVVVRAGNAEVLWLNEAMSHLAEELAARRFEALGQDDRFSQFAIGDVFNAYLYLESPSAFFLLPREGTGSLEQRGAGWLFLRWLVDQYGDGITRRLAETRRTGAENVEAVIGEPFSRLAAQWFLANYVSDLPDFEAPSRLRYTSWRFRTTYESLNEQAPSRFTRVFPLEPMVLDAGSFAFIGTLRSGSGEYFRVVQPPDGRAFTVRLTDPQGGAIATAAVARLNVVRVR